MNIAYPGGSLTSKTMVNGLGTGQDVALYDS